MLALLQKKFIVFHASAIWLANPRAIAASIIRKFPTIQSIEASRELPHTLTLQVSEYSGWGVLCHGEPEECFWIDRAGIAFDRAPGFSGLIVPKIRDMRSRE